MDYSIERNSQINDSLQKIVLILKNVCKNIIKTFDINLPENTMTLRNKSYEDLEKDKKIFAVYSCWLMSLYLFHALKDWWFDDISLCFWMGKKKNTQKENFHFWLKIQENEHIYLVDNREQMEIDIWTEDKILKNADGNIITPKKTVTNISKTTKLLDLESVDIKDALKKFTKKHLEIFFANMATDTKKSYTKRTIYPWNSINTPITIIPFLEE